MNFPIQRVMVYCGHEKNPAFGPYGDNIKKRVEMFEDLNSFREARGKNTWKVSTVAGESLVEELKKVNQKETLLVIPAGQSSDLDKVFSVVQTTFLLKEFFEKGGRGYFTCGAAYWSSRVRVYNEVCLEHPEMPKKLVKYSVLPIFQGTSYGPLCPFPGHKYKVGFYSDAVEITDGNRSCSIYLSGGGSFILEEESNQKVKVLARYPHSELLRLGVEEKLLEEREKAAIMVSIGEGAAILAMFHPYYSSQDIDVDVYEKTFPNCGTDWRRVHQKLSSFSVRMNFFLDSLLKSLEEMDFSQQAFL